MMRENMRILALVFLSAVFLAYSMDRSEKSIPVTFAPPAASLLLYNPGPQPRSHTDFPDPSSKREVIQPTDLSMNSGLLEARSIDPSRCNSSILSETYSSFQSSFAV